MSGTYKVTGINLKSVPLGESDRLLTILTREQGLLRAVAPNARKHKSILRGRSNLFIINELLIANGRSLDKIVQAESLESFPGLSQDLGKLTASQYLAEIVLGQALSQLPQAEIFNLLCHHLKRLETYSSALALPCLVHAVFHLLVISGIAPRVRVCCMTQQQIVPDFSDRDWRVGFSASVGGTVRLSELTRLAAERRGSQSSVADPGWPPPAANPPSASVNSPVVRDAIAISQYAGTEPGAQRPASSQALRGRANVDQPAERYILLNAAELALLQQLARSYLTDDGEDAALASRVAQPLDEIPESVNSYPVWLSVERVLRHYAQYHLEKPIRSAALIETCFLPLSKSASSVEYGTV